LRERVLAPEDKRQTIRAIGASLPISPSSVSKWLKLNR